MQPACLLRADNHRNKSSTTKALIQWTPPSPPIIALRPTDDRYHGHLQWSVRTCILFVFVVFFYFIFFNFLLLRPWWTKTQTISMHCDVMPRFLKNHLSKNLRAVPQGTGGPHPSTSAHMSYSQTFVCPLGRMYRRTNSFCIFSPIFVPSFWI